MAISKTGSVTIGSDIQIAFELGARPAQPTFDCADGAAGLGGGMIIAQSLKDHQFDDIPGQGR